MGSRFLRAAMLLVGTGSLAAQAMAQVPASARANPFATPSTLPFQAPRFDLIKDSDYQPAFETAMAQHLVEVQKIANNPAAPTFDNTIGALEKSGRMLDRVSLAFFGVAQANTNDTLDKVQEAEAPKLSQHGDAVNLNPKLFARVKTLWDKRAALKLTAEQTQVLKIYYDGFVHAGAQLSAADQTKLKALNTQLASLETSYQQKLLAAAKAGGLVVDDKAKLAGLDDGKIAAAANDAKGRGLDGKWLIPLQNTTQQPSLEDMTDRATREALFHSSITRAEKGDANDTRPVIQQLAMLRAQKAQLLGYPSWAAYTLYDQMAKTPQAAEAFMEQLGTATAPEQKREAAELQAQIDKDGDKIQLKPWDWDHYAAQVRQAKYDLDQNQVKPYFELHTVLEQGVFYAANQLYGVTFKRRTDIPVYQPDVMVYTVYDKDGSELGLMYFDYFKRDNKSGGAWMSNFVGQSKLLGTKPVIYNVANFQKPAEGQPALISSDDVTTMFHEFGHALHGLFANQIYPTVSGTNTARDWVEFPSQFNEHWALDPKVLAHYAKNYKTGAPIPQALVDKIKKAANFNQGYALGEVIAAAMLDMDWHSLPASAPKQDVDQFETAALAKTGLDVTDVPPRYRSSYFLHIWSNGYSAGYYAYLWTQMLEHDSYHWFMDHGGLTRENGQRFRDMILSKGHTEDYGPMFKAFYGKDPDVGPMLEEHGLAPVAQ
ncbi:M3 family metallopeptidase [Sphingomonas abietis]|uniref:M3 family metallopeptidase n=1 Tax=Sphingomonas abietis TaxID=3012344 RepID=A0ABY7NPC3_9SPHN|nr:M3 family metallopeptidase [Sphingomonas abietis]WBO23223.1 M3 family metallopeptidase [Sphingomonas abietis]